MDKNLIHILQHSLGITDGKLEYRNYYAAEPDDRGCLELERLGLMISRPCTVNQELRYFHVTDAGRKVAYDNLPPKPKLTRSQTRYQKFLDLDGCTGQTFSEYIKGRTYEEVERHI
jgi:hypothetical protein